MSYIGPSNSNAYVESNIQIGQSSVTVHAIAAGAVVSLPDASKAKFGPIIADRKIKRANRP